MKRRSVLGGLLASLVAMAVPHTASAHTRAAEVPKLSEESLEQLLVAIVKLTDESGRAICLSPRHILLPGVVRQYEAHARKIIDPLHRHSWQRLIVKQT